MKKTLQQLSVFLAAFVLPLCTSALLEWSFIEAHWSRQGLVLILMAAQFALAIFILRRMTKDL